MQGYDDHGTRAIAAGERNQQRVGSVLDWARFNRRTLQGPVIATVKPGD